MSAPGWTAEHDARRSDGSCVELPLRPTGWRAGAPCGQRRSGPPPGTPRSGSCGEQDAPDYLIGDPQLATPGISSFGRRHRLLPAYSREGYIAVPSCATDFPYREASTAAGYNIA